MLPPCSGLSRRGLETPESALLAERRPALTAPARDGERNLRSGRKKACGAVEQKKGAKSRAKRESNSHLWCDGQWFCEVRSGTAGTVVALEGFRKAAVRRTGRCRTDRVGRHHVRA